MLWATPITWNVTELMIVNVAVPRFTIPSGLVNVAFRVTFDALPLYVAVAATPAGCTGRPVSTVANTTVGRVALSTWSWIIAAISAGTVVPHQLFAIGMFAVETPDAMTPFGPLPLKSFCETLIVALL